MNASIVSLQVGMPRAYVGEGNARDWTSGIDKRPVAGPTRLTPTGFDGDGQADPKNHGGPDKAVNAYPAGHYPGWRDELAVDAAGLPFGSFGENLTIDGLTEQDVCVGDVWQAGAVVRLQVSQPRQPCWKLARHLRRPDVVLRVESTGRTGWYFRVLTPGLVAAGDALRLVERTAPQWTIARCNAVMSKRKTLRDEAAALAACAGLSASWRETLAAAVGSA